MGIIRLIILLLLVYLIWRLINSTRRALQPRPPAPTDGAPKMLKCRQCGTHVPENEAIRDGDRSFCSDAHRRAWLDHQQP